jgi:putative aldouronate transport system permease protein
MATDEASVQSTTQPNVRETGADRLFNIVNYALLIVILLVVLYPLIYVVSASFKIGRAHV